MKCKHCETTETPKWYSNKTECQRCWQRVWREGRRSKHTCSTCGSNDSGGWYEGGTKCAQCYKRQLEYGITDEQLKAMDGTCDICKVEAQTVVDHCHRTGRVRGELCPSCNIALGSFGDDRPGVMRVLDYLIAADAAGVSYF